MVVQCVPFLPAGRDPLIGAVVGRADLTSPGLGDVLDASLAGPGGGST